MVILSGYYSLEQIAHNFQNAFWEEQPQIENAITLKV